MPGGWPPGGIWLAGGPADMRRSFDGPVEPVTSHPVGNPAGGRWHVSGSRRRTMVRTPGSGHGGCFIRARRLERGLSASPATPGRRSVPLPRTGLSALPAGTGITVRRRRMRCPEVAGSPASGGAGPGTRRPGPPRHQPPGRCPVPDPAPGPVDRAGQVQRRPGHLRVSVLKLPGTASCMDPARPVGDRPAAGRGTGLTVAVAVRHQGSAAGAGEPRRVPVPAEVREGRHGPAAVAGHRPEMALPHAPRPARAPPGADRGPVHPDDGAPGNGRHWAPGPAPAAGWRGWPAGSGSRGWHPALPGRRQAPHEPVHEHPGEEGDVGAAAPGDAPAGRGGHGPVGPPDPGGGMAMADGHVPEPAGGGPAVDAVASDLVAVLRRRPPNRRAPCGVRACRRRGGCRRCPARPARRGRRSPSRASPNAGRTGRAPAGRPGPSGRRPAPEVRRSAPPGPRPWPPAARTVRPATGAVPPPPAAGRRSPASGTAPARARRSRRRRPAKPSARPSPIPHAPPWWHPK